MSIQDNIEQIRRRIAAACDRAGRDPQDVHLIAVSKVKPAEMIDEAYAAGQLRFGESYVQEFRDKADQVQSPVQWHYIGALQSNKVKYLRGRVAMIHSVDRLSLAREIDKQWAKIDEKIDVLIQVNVGEEESKSGTTAEDLEKLVRDAAQLPHLSIRGLMTLPPFLSDPEDVRSSFRQLRELAEGIDALEIPGVEMQELSMGMSHDFEIAVEEGATLVRVGTAIFGERLNR
ncbi:MAG TPA: YggS family pyridoxal phosphate-dependent enzyme [Desulfuromonadales bacterium]|nr:YggS family pyridoxal phosphate-dependent enzyme [Desulfuromonadales bacterium]